MFNHDSDRMLTLRLLTDLSWVQQTTNLALFLKLSVSLMILKEFNFEYSYFTEHFLTLFF